MIERDIAASLRAKSKAQSDRTARIKRLHYGREYRKRKRLQRQQAKETRTATDLLIEQFASDKLLILEVEPFVSTLESLASFIADGGMALCENVPFAAINPEFYSRLVDVHFACRFLKLTSPTIDIPEWDCVVSMWKTPRIMGLPQECVCRIDVSDPEMAALASVVAIDLIGKWCEWVAGRKWAQLTNQQGAEGIVARALLERNPKHPKHPISD